MISAPLQSANENYNNQLSMQFMYSSAAFMLQHPKVKDPVKIQTAGVEGTLKAYESILKVDKNARFDFLDGLMQQKKNGQLESYVASVSHTCGRSLRAGAEAQASPGPVSSSVTPHTFRRLFAAGEAARLESK